MGKGATIVMHRLAYFALISLVLIPVQSRGETACIDSALLAHSTVGITRYFDDGERAAQPDLLGIQGTGWFRSPTSLVTVEHVVAAMGLSTEEWKILTIQDAAEVIRSLSAFSAWRALGRKNWPCLNCRPRYLPRAPSQSGCRRSCRMIAS